MISPYMDGRLAFQHTHEVLTTDHASNQVRLAFILVTTKLLGLLIPFFLRDIFWHVLIL